MIFLREFYNCKGKVSTKNSWVWVVHALNYPYIMWVYLESEMYGNNTKNDSTYLKEGS